jgi:hypothetical protein
MKHHHNYFNNFLYEGFEKKMGFVDVQSVPTYFLVTKNETFNSLNMSISYTTEKLNIGGAMDLSSGKFTAPRTGTYFFSFTGMIGFPTSSSSVPYLILGFYLNGVEIGSGWNDEANTVASQEVPVVLQSTVNLQAGDQVWLQIKSISAGVALYTVKSFTGWILQENLSQSL